MGLWAIDLEKARSSCDGYADIRAARKQEKDDGWSILEIQSAK